MFPGQTELKLAAVLLASKDLKDCENMYTNAGVLPAVKESNDYRKGPKNSDTVKILQFEQCDVTIE